MSVTVDDLLDQLSEDDDRKPQLQIYFDTAITYIKNAVSADTSDAQFFIVGNVSPIYDVAVLSYSMDLWINRSTTMPPTTAVNHMVGQLRGLYSTWKEAQDGQNVQTE
jgi:Phage QLRG family, putative DNA packaging.